MVEVQSNSPASLQTVARTALTTIKANEWGLNHASLINLVCLSDHDIRAIPLLCVASVLCVHALCVYVRLTACCCSGLH